MHRYRSNMCAWGSSFQWFMGIIGGSNRPNRRCRGGRLLGATCGIIDKIMGGRLLGYRRLIGIIRYFVWVEGFWLLSAHHNHDGDGKHLHKRANAVYSF